VQPNSRARLATVRSICCRRRAFEARYGSIATVGYAAAVARIDAALDTLPVMRR
jgi:hypothetical protein